VVDVLGVVDLDDGADVRCDRLDRHDARIERMSAWLLASAGQTTAAIASSMPARAPVMEATWPSASPAG